MNAAWLQEQVGEEQRIRREVLAHLDQTDVNLLNESECFWRTIATPAFRRSQECNPAIDDLRQLIAKRRNIFAASLQLKPEVRDEA